MPLAYENITHAQGPAREQTEGQPKPAWGDDKQARTVLGRPRTAPLLPGTRGYAARSRHWVGESARLKTTCSELPRCGSVARLCEEHGGTWQRWNG
jgi:hypothetical protein